MENELIPVECGTILGIDTTGCKHKAIGGKKYAHVKVDYGTDYLFVEFLKKKSQVPEDGI